MVVTEQILMNANCRINIPATDIAQIQKEATSVPAVKAPLAMQQLEIAPRFQINFLILLVWLLVSII